MRYQDVHNILCEFVAPHDGLPSPFCCRIGAIYLQPLGVRRNGVRNGVTTLVITGRIQCVRVESSVVQSAAIREPYTTHALAAHFGGHLGQHLSNLCGTGADVCR